MYHAMASSAVFASHVNKGLTTPGLKKVPMPGYEASSRVQVMIESSIGADAKNRTDLVVNNLLERITLVE